MVHPNGGRIGKVLINETASLSEGRKKRPDIGGFNAIRKPYKIFTHHIVATLAFREKGFHLVQCKDFVNLPDV